MCVFIHLNKKKWSSNLLIKFDTLIIYNSWIFKIILYSLIHLFYWEISPVEGHHFSTIDFFFLRNYIINVKIKYFLTLIFICSIIYIISSQKSQLLATNETWQVLTCSCILIIYKNSSSLVMVISLQLTTVTSHLFL